MLKKWKLLTSKIALETPPFNVLEKTYQKPDKQGGFTGFILDIPNWANVVALNEKKEILLIQQFRIGTDQIELEIPGGIIEQGESPEEAAIRELREETGYNIKKIEQIGFVESNPAIMNNKCYTFVAQVSTRGVVRFDPDEIIESFFSTPKKVKEYLQTNRIKNAYCVLALLWYSFYEKSF